MGGGMVNQEMVKKMVCNEEIEFLTLLWGTNSQVRSWKRNPLRNTEHKYFASGSGSLTNYCRQEENCEKCVPVLNLCCALATAGDRLLSLVAQSYHQPCHTTATTCFAELRC